MDETTKAIIERIDAVAAKMGTTAERVVGEVARLGVAYAVLSTLALIAGIVCIVLAVRGKVPEFGENGHEAAVTGKICAAIGAFILLVVAMMGLAESAEMFAAPTLHLIEKVLK